MSMRTGLPFTSSITISIIMYGLTLLRVVTRLLTELNRLSLGVAIDQELSTLCKD